MLLSNGDKELTKFGRNNNVMITCINGATGVPKAVGEGKAVPLNKSDDTKVGDKKVGDGMDMSKVMDRIENDEGYSGDGLPSMKDVEGLIANFTQEDWDSITPEFGMGSEDITKALENMEEPDIDDESMEKLQDLFSPFFESR